MTLFSRQKSTKSALNLAAVKKRLAEDIKTLREPEYGYLRAGLPRFPALFGRDSLIASWQLLDYDPTIARTTLRLLSNLQGKRRNNASEEEPGKILHEWHPKPQEYKLLPWPLPYYGSVDSTPLFIYLCGLYYEKTVDTAWLQDEWPHIESALEWCAAYGDTDGDLLLEYERKNSFGLFHQGWKDSRLNHLNFEPPIELVEVQGYYYAALREGQEIALMLKKTALARKLGERSRRLKQNFIKAFWLPQIRHFAFGLERSGIPDARKVSNPGHLLFTGILDERPDLAESVAAGLFTEDMWTPYGIRTHSMLNPDFDPRSYHLGSIWPHDNWIIAQGLKRCGFTEQYQKIKLALYAAYEALGEIPELYAVVGGKIEKIPVACSPQAWASGALLNFVLEDTA